MLNFKDLLKNIKNCPKEFPVETALGLTFTIAAILVCEDVVKMFYPLAFVLIQFFVTITLRKINQPAYYASYLLVWILYFSIDGSLMCLEQPWFIVLNIISAIVLLTDIRKNDNKTFAISIFSKIEILFSALLISGIISAMVSAIIGSIMYLFSTEFWHLLAHVNFFIWLTFFPLSYCYITEHSENQEDYNRKFLKIIIDFIFSPALVIYTVVLLCYIFKIIVVQELPRGGVAYMVSIYIALALLGNLLNKLLEKSNFNWFYDKFAFIAIAPLALQWIGVVYRINEYGLTESRVYLLIVNILVTIFPIMLLFKKTNRYNLFTIIMMSLMVCFTCIPPISARNIGIKNQYERFINHAKEIGALDVSTWTLKNDIDIYSIRQDSTLNKAYQALIMEYRFLNHNTDTIRKKFSDWEYFDLYFEDDNWYYFDLLNYVDKIPLEGFNQRYLKSHSTKYEDGILTVDFDDQTVLEYHLQDTLRVIGKDLSKNPLRALRYHNDSILITIDGIYGYDKDGYFNISEDCLEIHVDVYGK